ncbi:Aspartate aminotransferase [Enhygromyxa salina]|uniref:Aminotransferase n=1 Tax=Enhygromyxa salina TaxID=215803 RepID=A0A2S9YB72_9BACT|nr:pyridoxal phosphate-dependent aminotransferase [Enhygromyxa salina]PRQ02261.1 Aspartate aminotransferase [Enhygromyxa salina]
MTTHTHPLDINAVARSIKPSATLAISARAGELRAAGRKVFNFSAGEPDFAPPAAVAASVTRRLADAPVGYAPVPGLPQLRDAAAAELSAYHGVEITRDQLIVSCGAKHSLANLFMVTLDPGDEVVIAAPYWVSYPEMVRLGGGTSKIVSCPRAQGFKLTPAQLREAVGPKTKYLLLNSPSNPTGVAYTTAELRALAEVLAERAPQTWILTDDIYRKLTYGQPSVSVVRALAGIPGIEDQIVIVDGVSKSHAMTGWRIGFLAAPVPVAKAVTAIQGQTTSGASTPAQWAALAAVTEASAKAEVEVMRERFTERRAAMIKGLRAAGAELVEPDGAFYVFPDFSALCGEGARFADDLALAGFLLEDKGLATVPGTAFGAPGHLRLSFACSMDDIEAGMELLRQALASSAT